MTYPSQVPQTFLSDGGHGDQRQVAHPGTPGEGPEHGQEHGEPPGVVGDPRTHPAVPLPANADLLIPREDRVQVSRDHQGARPGGTHVDPHVAHLVGVAGPASGLLQEAGHLSPPLGLLEGRGRDAGQADLVLDGPRILSAKPTDRGPNPPLSEETSGQLPGGSVVSGARGQGPGRSCQL